MKIAKVEKPAPHPPLSTIYSAERARLREIEEQIDDLAGALRLRMNMYAGREYSEISATNKVTFRIVPRDIDQIMSLPSRYRTNEGQSTSAATVPATHQSTITCKIAPSLNPVYMRNNSEEPVWQFSSTEFFLPVDLGAFLVADVSLLARYLFRTT